MKCLIDNDTICDKDNDFMNSCYPCIPLQCYEKGRADEREKTIDECIKTITDFCGGLPNNNMISALECLKREKIKMARLVNFIELGADVDVFERIHQKAYCETCIHKVTKADIDAIEATARADERKKVIEEFREYLKTVIPCEMPQDMWDMGVDNTCDRMLKEQKK